MKRTIVWVFGLTIVFALTGLCWAEKGGSIKLQLYSWNVPADPSTKVLEQIAKDLEEGTKGQVASQITFQSLGGPNDAYDIAVGGLADIVYVSLPYTPGRFPFTDMLGLPINFPTNTIAGKANYELLKRGYLDKQFADVRVLSVGSCSPYIFYWAKSVKADLDAFKGKKISASGGPWSDVVKALGGIPVGGIAAPDCYMSL
jgi:TRAP-type C4-dicarboxylate transport system substrate-binding protein